MPHNSLIIGGYPDSPVLCDTCKRGIGNQRRCEHCGKMECPFCIRKCYEKSLKNKFSSGNPLVRR